MFRLVRLLRFWVPVLLTGSIPGLLFALSVITELRAYQVSPADVWPFCLLLAPSCPPVDWEFWFFVLLNMIPGLVAVVIACRVATSFVQSLYGLKSREEGWGFLVHSLFGLPYESDLWHFLIIKQGAIQGDEAHVLRRVGGPGGLIIHNDSAVILEKAGRLTRVLGSGFAYLEPFEKVWDVIDLRPQRSNFEVEAMTQEGIPVTCHADINFKIDDGGKKSTREEPYPMTEEAVFKAATSKWIREAWRTEPDRLMTWTKQVIIGETEGTLRSILARYPLDQLIDPSARRNIQAELEEALRGVAPNLGAKIIRVALGDIKLEDEVIQQWIEKWQAEGKRRMMEIEARGQAARISIEANARIQAQVKMIANTARAFASMARYDEGIPSRSVILRFVRVINRTSVELLGKPYWPYDVMHTLSMEVPKVEATAQIFLSYAREDKEKVEKLYQELSDAGFKPWMAPKDIQPGEKWERAIQKAIQRSDFCLVCLSANSIDKRGWVQREIRLALDIWQEKLDSDIYLIPVRLEGCEVPERLRDFQWVNLFEESGWTRLIEAIQAGMERWRNRDSVLKLNN